MFDKKSYALLDWHLRHVGQSVWSPQAQAYLSQPPLLTPGKASLKKQHPLFDEPKQVSDWVQIAQETALGADSHDALRKAVSSFEGCDVKKFAQRCVFSDGNPQTSLLILGEAPGEAEDLKGKPFVGESGQLMTKILQSVGLERERDYLISNVFYWRPPGNRQPTQQELMLCRPFVLRLIALQRPSIILLLGKTAMFVLFGGTISITRMRGTWRMFQADDAATPIPVLPSYHPAFLLRQPGRKPEVWQDMLSLKQKMKDLALSPFH